MDKDAGKKNIKIITSWLQGANYTKDVMAHYKYDIP